MTFWFNKKKKKEAKDTVSDDTFKYLISEQRLIDTENKLNKEVFQTSSIALTKMFDKELLDQIKKTSIAKECADFEDKASTPMKDFTKKPDHNGSPWYGKPAPKDRSIPFPKFLIGHTHKQINGDYVLIIGMSNPGTINETVYTMDGEGKVIHRYNRRDFGRVTGSSHTRPDPRNLEVTDYG